MGDDGFQVGTRFGPYVLKRQIGAGGMGSVYEAQDTALDRVVALKLISGPYAQDPAFRQRLQREARIAGRLQDPHVVPIHSAGEIDGQLYVDMRLINGTDLDTMLRTSGPLSAARAVGIVKQVASALDAAHAVGVLHRDVKPGNILVTTDDFTYLVDFGIANAASEQALTQMGDVLGTWTYMSPERFTGAGENVTARADTYGLACVLFEALTGAPPFMGDRASLIGAHISAPVPRLSLMSGLPPALDDVISRGLAKNPEDRYPSSGEFARAAEAAIAGSPPNAAAVPVAVQGGSPSYPGAPPTAPVTPPPPTVAAFGQFPGSQPPPPSQPPPHQYPGSQPPTQFAGSQPPPYQGAPPLPPISQPPVSQPQWGPQPGMPPSQPPSSNGRKGVWIAAAAAAVLVVALVAGFVAWRFTRDEPTPPPDVEATDLSTLDVGRYDTEPHPLPDHGDEEESRFAEASRLAEGIANPYDIQEGLSYVYGFAVPDPALAATSISGTSTPVVQPVLEKYGMVSAYIVQGFSKNITDFIRDGNGDSVIIMLSSYANPDVASKAAAEMDATDAAVNPANQTVKIPRHPDAHAHYATGNASIAATIARGYFVASVMTVNREAIAVDDMRNWMAEILDAQVPLMGDVFPTAEAALTSLPLDPDDMLRRIFVPGEVPSLSDTFASLGQHASRLCANSAALQEDLLGEAGVDRCATSSTSYLWRASDEAAAADLMPKLADADRDVYIERDIDPPAGLDSAKCSEQKEEVWADNANARFQCFVTQGQYVGLVAAAKEKDVLQRASAQYAILVNSE